MRTRTLYLAALLALAPAALAAQDSTLAASRVNASLEAAAEAGIPVALLERKIAEGKAKGVSLTRIAAAVSESFSA